MNGFLTGLSSDPRASLQSGLYTAESAILNLDLVASLKKPDGFYDPNNIFRGKKFPIMKKMMMKLKQ